MKQDYKGTVIEMKKEWTVYYLGEEHIVTYIPKKEAGEHKLYLDGSRVEIEKKSYVLFGGIDQEFKIGHKKYHFVISGKTAELAVDGKYVSGGEKYVPLKVLRKIILGTIFLIIFLAYCMITDASKKVLLTMLLYDLVFGSWAYYWLGAPPRPDYVKWKDNYNKWREK